jgi:molybdenum cofactor guanylyltransferase
MPESRIEDITGAILIGGKSSRMGKDKTFLEVEGRPIIERILEVFSASFERVLLVGDRAERFARYDIEVVPDLYPGSALGGVYTGLLTAETEHIFVSSCDLPFPNQELLRYLCSLRDNFDAVVPETARGYEPLFALYKKSCLVPINSQLERGDFCAYGYYPQVRIRYVEDEELERFDPDGRAFMNVNTPEEYAKIAREA